MHLRHIAARLGTARGALQAGGLETQRGQGIRLAVFQAIIQRIGRATDIGLGVATTFNPGAAHTDQAAAHINVSLRVGVGARGVLHGHGFAVALHDFTQRHLDVSA